MATLNPDHLLLQAERLSAQSGPGAPLQVEQYNLVYRGIDHGRLRDMCNTVRHRTLPKNYAACVPDGFSTHIQTFAGHTVDLQEKRHSADYDPAIRVLKSDATLAISRAWEALGQWDHVPGEERRIFVLLLLFPPRRN